MHRGHDPFTEIKGEGLRITPGDEPVIDAQRPSGATDPLPGVCRFPRVTITRGDRRSFAGFFANRQVRRHGGLALTHGP